MPLSIGLFTADKRDPFITFLRADFLCTTRTHADDDFKYQLCAETRSVYFQ